MANHSSTEKAIRKTIRKTAVNKNRKTRIKTYIKRVLAAVTAGKKEEACKGFLEAQSEIMRAVSGKLLKKNTGSRQVSRLANKVKSIGAKLVAGLGLQKSTPSKIKAAPSAKASKTTKQASTKAVKKESIKEKVIKTSQTKTTAKPKLKASVKKTTKKTA